MFWEECNTSGCLQDCILKLNVHTPLHVILSLEKKGEVKMKNLGGAFVLLPPKKPTKKIKQYLLYFFQKVVCSNIRL